MFAMLVRVMAWVAAAALGLLWTGAASAQALGGLEWRGGVYAHSVDTGAMWSFDRIQDANVELLIDIGALSHLPIGSIRPHVGATIAVTGRESMIYAGLSWTFTVPSTSVFIEGTFGGALHNGALSGASWPDRNLGCPLLFRESASVGVNLTEALSVMVTVEHASHAGLCGSNNRGLTNMGVRLGVTF